MFEPSSSAPRTLEARRLRDCRCQVVERRELFRGAWVPAIDEAILIGTRLHLLSARPGRTLATFDTGDLTFGDLGSQRFETVARTVHDLLFAREPAHA